MAKLTLIVNQKWLSVNAKVLLLKNWFKPLELEVEILETNFTEIPFVPYKDVVGEPKGIDNAWYDQKIVPLAKGSDIVLFVVAPKDWGGSLANWGYRTDRAEGPVELQIVCNEVESVYHPSGEIENGFVDKARHEILHGCYLLTGQLDRTHEFIKQNKLKEALNDLIFPEPRTAEKLSLLQQIAEALKTLINLLIKKDIKTMEEISEKMEIPSKLDKFCLAIREYEGYYPAGENPAYPRGSRSWRNKNPGNLKWVGQPLAVGKDAQNFAIFQTYEDGYATLKKTVFNACSGFSKVYKPTDTILQYFEKYAPSTDFNFPRQYALYVCSKAEIDINSPISDLLI